MDFMTSLLQVEGLMNARPLLQTTADHNDVTLLTPEHFLTNNRNPLSLFSPKEDAIARVQLGNYPKDAIFDAEAGVLSEKNSRKKFLAELIFRRFWSLVVPNLRRTSRWLQGEADIRVGQFILCILPEKRTSPPRWPVVRVVEIIRSGTGKIDRVGFQSKAGGKTFYSSPRNFASLPAFNL